MSFTSLFWPFVLTLLASGLIAIMEIIKKKNPQAANAIAMAASFGGYIGLGAMITAIITFFNLLRGLSFLMRFVPVSTIMLLAACVSAVLLGIFMSIDLFTSWGVLNKEKGSAMSAKLAGIKIPLGFVAVISSVYLILWNLIGWGF